MPAPHWAGNGGLDRVAYYQLYDLIDARRYNRAFNYFNNALLRLQKFLKITRFKSYSSIGGTFWGGLGYWSLHRSAMKRLLAHQLIRRPGYYHSLCAEEFMPHSILMNDPFIQLHPERLVNCSLRYVHWESSHGELPGILDLSHLPILKEMGLLHAPNYPMLFARKFDSLVSNDLVAHLPINSDEI